MKNEETLMRNFQTGSGLALDHLMQVHMKSLTFFAANLVGDRAIAEEIVSDAFIKLYHGRANFTGLPAIKSFLYIVTRNACYDYLKSASRKHALVREPIDNFLGLSSETSDVMTQMIHGEVIQLLYKEIEKLPGQQSVIFRLSYLEGLGTEEIAARLGMSTNAVKLGRSRAQRRLKAVFEKRDLLYIMLLLDVF